MEWNRLPGQAIENALASPHPGRLDEPAKAQTFHGCTDRSLGPLGTRLLHIVYNINIAYEGVFTVQSCTHLAH